MHKILACELAVQVWWGSGALALMGLPASIYGVPVAAQG